MEFTYFQAPMEEMAEFVGTAHCSLCGQAGPCFRVTGGAVCPGPTPDCPLGCYTCLREGRFGFTHSTAAGLLTESGLEVFSNEETVYTVDPSGNVVGVTPNTADPLAYRISEKAQQDLHRTPEFFRARQKPGWLCHCDDFMAFMGHWEQEDFDNAAPDGDGRALFLSMAEEWDSDRWPAGEYFHVNADAEYVVFRCRHCGAYAGYSHRS